MDSLTRGRRAAQNGGMDQPSAPEQRPLTERGRRTRQKLLEAAEAVFGERGYEHASVAEITQRAGVAQGTFYVYFPDKLTVFVKLVDDLGDRLRAEIRQGITGLTDRIDVEREGFRSFFKFVARHRALYRIVRQAEFVDRAAFERYYRRMGDAYARGLKDAAEKGQIEPLDPEITAYGLMGLADFLGMRFILWESAPQIDRVLEQAMALIRFGMEPASRRDGGKAPGKKR
ncbi:MAG TPA: TetR/AcrR family transcriptional regulator [Myxococcales bacterium]|nr:TetR/AcrR family transcriptional regulator [Myxococcales bacterium]